jgi:hypothetical protein
MELEKCSCYLSVWDYQEDGYAYTIPPNELGRNIVVQNLQGNNIEIKQMPSDKSQKLLGVMKNPMGNQQDEVKHLREKSDKIAIQINMLGNAVTVRTLSGRIQKIQKNQRKRKEAADDEMSGGELDSHNCFLIWSVT